ncbi:MAG: hypothetical protein M3O70_15730 [Actinomycetota bacterium]|nr:hypothetical protein [Actinomycetota bacterium]
MDQALVGPRRVLAFDTSVYINSAKLEELDVADLIGAARGERIYLLVPMAVVDELDTLKQSGKPHTRWRAAYTLMALTDFPQRCSLKFLR